VYTDTLERREELRIELDTEYDILYIELREGDVGRTEDLEDGVHLDFDAENQMVGLEFLSLAAFEDFVKDRDLPSNPIEWLSNEADLRQILLGPRSKPEA
jgi:uncharacterized protein YuzE